MSESRENKKVSRGHYIETRHNPDLCCPYPIMYENDELGKLPSHQEIASEVQIVKSTVRKPHRCFFSSYSLLL